MTSSPGGPGCRRGASSPSPPATSPAVAECPMRALALTAAAVTGAGMIATPLARQGGSARRRLAGVVVGGLATTTAANAVRRWGPARAASAAATITLATTVIEHIGASSGFPFGRYRYTGRLRPRVAGVPVVVPLAWWAMAVPAREVAHAALDRCSTAGRRVALGTLALTAWDLFLDPQMTAERFWRWTRPGGYRGIPLTNYAGWVVTSAGVMAALERLLPPGEADPALTSRIRGDGRDGDARVRRLLPRSPRRRRRRARDAADRGDRHRQVAPCLSTSTSSSSAPASAGWRRPSVSPRADVGSSSPSASRSPAASWPRSDGTATPSTSVRRC